MSDTPVDSTTMETQQDNNPVATLRDEFAQQFKTLKESFEAELRSLKDTNESLSKQNADLQRALIRSAVNEPAPAPVQKTEQELKDEQIMALADKAYKYSKV